MMLVHVPACLYPFLSNRYHICRFSVLINHTMLNKYYVVKRTYLDLYD